MIDFEYYNPAKIIFGEHSEQKLKSLLARLIWLKTNKTRKLREIKRKIENTLWKENI